MSPDTTSETPALIPATANRAQLYDAVVIGAGLLGSVVAYHLALGGMKVVVCNDRGLFGGPSRSHSGMLQLQSQRLALHKLAHQGHSFWRELGSAAGFEPRGGYLLAFNDEEAALLESRTQTRAAAGIAVQMCALDQLAGQEPALAPSVRAAAFCAQDATVNPNKHAGLFRRLLASVGAHQASNERIIAIDPFDADDGTQAYELVSAQGSYKAKSLVLACGAWLPSAAALLGLRLPIQVDALTLSAIERYPQQIRAIFGHVMNRISFYQTRTGTTLVGGNWMGSPTQSPSARIDALGDLYSAREQSQERALGQNAGRHSGPNSVPDAGRDTGRVRLDTLIPNLRLAQYAIPYINSLRLIRAWTAVDATAPDGLPMLGALPGLPNVYVLGGIDDGYLVAPGLAQALADALLGRDDLSAYRAFTPTRLRGLQHAGT